MSKAKTPVIQLDYETGEEIERYPSLRAAALDNFIDAESLHYALNKAGGCMRLKGLKFKYADKETICVTRDLKRVMWVVDYETGEKIKRYESLTAASKGEGVSENTIRRALKNNKGKTKHKKIRFAEEI